MSIVDLFYKVFIVLKIKMALINCLLQLVKGAIKGCLEQWADWIDNSPGVGATNAILG